MMARTEDPIEERPAGLKSVGLSALLGFLALLGFGGTMGIVNGLVATNTLWGPWAWQTALSLAANLLMLVGGVGGLLLLKPWRAGRRAGEPVSPATRRTNLLFGLSGLVGVLAVVALSLGASGSDHQSDVWSNSANLSPAFALIAIAVWLLSVAISWWWYYSADEHERRANDVGFLIGGGLFMAVTPVWWIASRAGLLPPPDAMILWFVMVLAMGIGWLWYRSR